MWYHIQVLSKANTTFAFAHRFIAQNIWTTIPYIYDCAHFPTACPLPWPPQRCPVACSGNCKVHFIAYYFPVISVCRFCFPFSICCDTFFPELVPLSRFLPHPLSFPLPFLSLSFLVGALRFKTFSCLS